MGLGMKTIIVIGLAAALAGCAQARINEANDWNEGPRCNGAAPGSIVAVVNCQ